MIHTRCLWSLGLVLVWSLVTAPAWAADPGRCGDGVLDPGEQCDDGDTHSGDGCAGACLLERGYFCLYPGEPCQALPARDQQGREFFLGFIPNLQENYGVQELHLTGKVATQVLIEYPADNPTFSQTITIDPTKVEIVQLPLNADITGSVHLVAQDEFIAYMVSRGPYTSDAGVAIPVDALGTDYVIAGTPGAWGGYTEAAATLVAPYDQTTVQVGAQTFTLHRGQELRLVGNDIIGAWVHADRPIALTSGTGCANVPNVHVWACDTVFEMIPPADTWGTTVPVGPLPDRPGGSYYQIYAAQDGTFVYQNSTSIAALDRGEHVNVGPVAGPLLFSASKPIYVVQYMTGQDSPGASIGDPFMLSVSPAEQFIKEYTFSTAGGAQFAQHFLQIYAPTDVVGQVTLDGVPVNPAYFQPIPSTPLSAALLPISEGVHRTSSPKPHGIATLGLNAYDSYGFTGGALFESISLQDGNPPRCELAQPHGKLIQGTARDDRPEEDANHNGVLDPGEDSNGNGRLDRDTWLSRVEVFGAQGASLSLSFTPGDRVASFSLSVAQLDRIYRGALLAIDGVGNVCTAPFALGPDADADGVIDANDQDSDNDGVPNAREWPTGVNFEADHDGDGLPDWRDAGAPGFADINGDGVDDRADQDRDGLPNHLDLDSDGDGLADIAEQGLADANGDGRVDGFADADGDGLAAALDADEGGQEAPLRHHDGDGLPDLLDADDDGDGLLTAVERPLGTDHLLADTDADGINDQVEANGGLPVDTDNDGIIDALDQDSDGDTDPDLVEGVADRDGDGVGNWRDFDCQLAWEGQPCALPGLRGACAQGQTACVYGALSCVQVNFPGAEICDGADNDCDGATDESLQRACATSCGGGVEACAAGAWQGCTAPLPETEVCDGADNDCNGAIDDSPWCRCLYFPEGGEVDVQEEWLWSSSQTLPQAVQVIAAPAVAQLTDDDGDGLVGQGDTPEVLIATTTASAGPGAGAWLRALDGATGAERWVATARPIQPWTTPAVADLDGDGLPEIVAPGWHGDADRAGVVAFDHQGQLLWVNRDLKTLSHSTQTALAVGDIDPSSPGLEIASCQGLVSATGQTRWHRPETLRGVARRCAPALADLDEDGDLEIVTDVRAWRYDGTPLWHNAALEAMITRTDAAPAVADLDGDGAAEVILANNRLYVLDGRTGALLTSMDLPGTGLGGAPLVVDLDNDGLPEIVSATSSRLSALRFRRPGGAPTLQLAWSVQTHDYSGATSTASAFDFNGDGLVEVAYNDEQYLRLYNGADGALLTELQNWSGTAIEYPVIADVDNDGNAELLLARNTIGGHHNDYDTHPLGLLSGLVVLGDANDNWTGAPRHWNQYAAHTTLSREDNSAPHPLVSYWKSNETNNFRVNMLQDAEPFLAPDLVITGATAPAPVADPALPACPADWTLSVTVCNDGDQRAPAGVQVGLWRQGDAQPAAMTATTQALEPAGPQRCQTLSISWLNDAAGPQTWILRADSDNKHNECDEDNNQFLFSGALQALEDESCDNLDNNCDGVTDEALTRDCNILCHRGQEECVAGLWANCDAPPVMEEVCDGIDNDCDDRVDEVQSACGDGAYACVCEGSDCDCVYALQADNQQTECALGCPLGTICGADLTCVSWCERDQTCPPGEVCGAEGVCVPVEALALQEPAPTAPLGGCATTPTRAPARPLWLALASLAALLTLRRR